MQEKYTAPPGPGRDGEDLAAAALMQRGFTILARNVRFKSGELDLVTKRQDMLHFFEVKVRGPGSITPARESLTHAQRGRIRRAAALYLQREERRWRGKIPPAHFGVVAIDINSAGRPSIEVIEDAYT